MSQGEREPGAERAASRRWPAAARPARTAMAQAARCSRMMAAPVGSRTRSASVWALSRRRRPAWPGPARRTAGRRHPARRAARGNRSAAPALPARAPGRPAGRRRANAPGTARPLPRVVTTQPRCAMKCATLTRWLRDAPKRSAISGMVTAVGRSRHCVRYMSTRSPKSVKRFSCMAAGRKGRRLGASRTARIHRVQAGAPPLPKASA